MPPWHGQGELYMYASPLVQSISNVGAVLGCQQFRIVMHDVTDPSIRQLTVVCSVTPMRF